jgi:hypothetical protein
MFSSSPPSQALAGELVTTPSFPLIQAAKAKKKNYTNSGMFILDKVEVTADRPSPLPPAPAPKKGAPQPAPVVEPTGPAPTFKMTDTIQMNAKAFELDKLDFMGKSGFLFFCCCFFFPPDWWFFSHTRPSPRSLSSTFQILSL